MARADLTGTCAPTTGAGSDIDFATAQRHLRADAWCSLDPRGEAVVVSPRFAEMTGIRHMDQDSNTVRRGSHAGAQKYLLKLADTSDLDWVLIETRSLLGVKVVMRVEFVEFMRIPRTEEGTDCTVRSSISPRIRRNRE